MASTFEYIFEETSAGSLIAESLFDGINGLIDEINDATGGRAVEVTAANTVVGGVPSLLLVADVAGIPFTVGDPTVFLLPCKFGNHSCGDQQLQCQCYFEL